MRRKTVLKLSSSKKKAVVCFLAILLVISFGDIFLPGVAAAADISSYVTVTTANERSTMDRSTRLVTSTSDITITNASDETIDAPLHAVIEIFDTAYENVQMPDALGGPGTSPYDKYYFDLSGMLGNGTLAPGASATFHAVFVRYYTVRFRYDVTTYATLSGQPQNPPTVTIQADPETIQAGQESVLSWSSTDADNLTIDQGLGSVDPDGSMSVSPTTTTTYTITATGSGGTATASVTVTVVYLEPTVSIVSDPQTILSGSPATLTWSSTDAETAIIDNGVGDVEPNGSITVSPTETTTYSITVTGPGGSATASVTLTVTYPAPLVSIHADPDTIQVGEASTLTWTSENADTAFIDSGIGDVAANGSVQITPALTTTFTITVTGPGGTATANTTVTVQEIANLPPVANAGADQTLNLAQGQTSIDVTLDGSGSGDPDGMISSYVWSGTPDPADTSQPMVALGLGVYTFDLVVFDDDGAASDADTVTITIEPPLNTPPVADAGGPYFGIVGEAIAFDGSGSYDPDNNSLTYDWQFGDGGVAAGPAPTHVYSTAGVHIVSLTVSDGQVSHTGQTQATVTYGNRPPALEPVDAQQVNEGQTVAFQIIGSDPDNDLLTFDADGLPAGARFEPTSLTNVHDFEWTPTFEQSQTEPYTVTFRVSDGELESTLTVLINVIDVNRAPVMDPVPDQQIGETELLSFQIQGTDPDGDSLAYSADNLPEGAFFDPVDGSFDWTPTFDQAGNYTVTFAAIDPDGLSAAVDVVIEVINLNRAPSLEHVTDRTISETKTLVFSIYGDDPDGDTLTYAAGNLPANAAFDAANQAFNWTPASGYAGTYQVQFSVSDGVLSDTIDVRIVVRTFDANNSPALASIAQQTIDEGQLLSFQVVGNDPNGDPLVYTAANLPSGASFESTAEPNIYQFVWTPDYDQAGLYTVDFTAVDPGGLADTINVDITVNNVNRPPFLTPVYDRNIAETKMLTFVVYGDDPDGDDLYFTAADLPEGADFDPYLQEFTWIPTNEQAGEYDVGISVSDGDLSDSMIVHITVIDYDPNQSPSLTAINDQGTDEGQMLAFDLSASDPNGDDLIFEVFNLPVGAGFTDNGDGTAGLAWTPAFDQAGDYTVTFTVIDTSGLTDTMDVNIQVYNVNRRPSLEALEDQQVDEGTELIIQLEGSDPDQDALVYAVDNPPEGASLDPQTGVFAWTPTFDQAGGYNFVFTVSDGALDDEQTVLIEVLDVNRAPEIVTTEIPNAQIDQMYDFQIIARDLDGDALTFTIGQATAPMTIDADTGQLAWQPSSDDIGDYSLTVEVSDGRGGSDSHLFGLSVPDTIPPAIRLNVPKTANPGTAFTAEVHMSDNDAITAVSIDGIRTELTPPYPRATTQQQVINLPTELGPVTLVATAWDPAGNAAEVSAIIQIVATFDTTPPEVTLSVPAQATQGQVIRLTAVVSDNEGVASVMFQADGSPIGSAPVQNPFVTYQIPVDAVDGTVIDFRVDVQDFSGNTAFDEDSTLVVVPAQADTTPPDATIDVPAQTAIDDPLPLVIDTPEETCLSQIDVYVNHTLAASYFVPIGATFDVPLPEGLASGMRALIEIVVTDCSGNQTITSDWIDVTAPVWSVVAGEVYDDHTGLPLPGADVSFYSPGGALITTQTDDLGRYSFAGVAGAGRLTMTKPGYNSVERVNVDLQASSGMEVLDARLTPWLASAATVPAVLGAGLSTPFSVVRGGMEMVLKDMGIDPASLDPMEAQLVIPAGALTLNRDIKLAQISPQGLCGLLPGGWSPIGVFEIAPTDINFQVAAELTIPNPLDLNESDGIVAVHWDTQAHAWRVVAAGSLSGDNRTLATAVHAGGQYAFVVPDVLPQAPPAPIVNELLEGIAAPLLPDPVSATITPEPKIIFYQPGVHSDVGIRIEAAGTHLTSGAPIMVDVAEQYNFYSGDRIAPTPFQQDIVFYALGQPRLYAAFPVTPSQAFEPLSLDHGVIDLDVLAPTAAERPVDVMGPEGGTVELSSGETLTLPPEAVEDFVPVALSVLTSDELGLEIPDEATLVGAFHVALGGSELDRPAALSTPLPQGFAPQGQILLVKLIEVQGATRMSLVGLGEVQDNDIVAVYTLDANSNVELPGIMTTGRYLFVEIETETGFAAGSVFDPDANPLPGAIVSTDDLPIIALSTADGRYVACVNTGIFTLTALDPIKMDTGTATGVLPLAGSVEYLDITVEEKPPAVFSFSPVDGQENVPLTSAVVVRFTEPLDPLTVTSANLVLTGPQGPVTGTLTLSSGNTQVTFRPGNPLETNTLYTFTVTQGIRDLAGYALESDFFFSFTSLDTLPPAPPPAGSIVATIPDEDGRSTVSATQGTAGAHDTVTIINTDANVSTPVLVNADGSFSANIDAGIMDKVVISITDPAGNETVVSVGAFRNPDGSMVIGPEGGLLEADNGVILDIPAGAFPEGAIVRIAGLSEGDIGISSGSDFPFVAGFELECSDWPAKYLNASAPVSSSVSPEAHGIVALVSEAFGRPMLSIVDTARIAGGRLTTSSPPCPGIVARTGRYAMYMNENQKMAMEQALLNIVAPSDANWAISLAIETMTEMYSTYFPMYEDTIRGIIHAAARPTSQEYAGEAYEEMYNSLCMPMPANEPMKVIIRDAESGDLVDVIDVDATPSGQSRMITYQSEDDEIAPAVIEIQPIQQVLEGQHRNLEIRFSEPITPESADKVVLVSSRTNTVYHGNWELQENNTLLVFAPDGPLPMGENFQLKLNEIEDLSGNKYEDLPVRFYTFEPYLVFPTSTNRLDQNAIANDLGVDSSLLPSKLWFIDVDFVTKSPEKSFDGKWHTDLVAIQAGEEWGYRLFYVDLSDPTNPEVQSAFRTDRRYPQKNIRLLDDVLITPRPDASGDPQYWKKRELHYRIDEPSIRICAAPNTPDLLSWQDRYCRPDPEDPNAPVCEVITGGCGDLAVTSVDSTDYSYLWSYDVTDYYEPDLENRIKWASSRMLSDNGFSQGSIRHYEAPAGMGTAMGLATLNYMDIEHSGMLHENTVGAYIANYGIGLELVDLGLNLPTINDEDRKPGSSDTWALNETLKTNLQLYYRDVAVVDGKVVAIAADISQNTRIRTLEIFRPDLAGEPTGMVQLPYYPQYMATVTDFPVRETDEKGNSGLVLHDLAIISVEEGGVSIVDIPKDGLSQKILGHIMTPEGIITKHIQVDRHAGLAYVAATGFTQGVAGDRLLVIDLKQPFGQATDVDNDSWDDRIIGKIAISLPDVNDPVYLHGFKLDWDRGLIYAGIYAAGKQGLAIIKIRECPEIGIDLKVQPEIAVIPAEVAKEAFQKAINKGLTEIQGSCGIEASDTITMIEHGEGACIWNGNCKADYQAVESQHNFVALIPQTMWEQRDCIIENLYAQFVDEEDQPVSIEVEAFGLEVRFENVEFFPMIQEDFESAALNIEPNNLDLGLARQAQLLKWLITGSYVSAAGLNSDGRELKDILETLKQSLEHDGDELPRINALEGYELAKLQEINLLKSGALIRFYGSAKPETSLYSSFQKDLKIVAAAALHSILAKVIATEEGNHLAVDAARSLNTGLVCLDTVDSEDPFEWEPVPCMSFEHYVATIAARTVRDTDLDIFTPEEIQNTIYHLYRVAQGLETIQTESEANAFIAMAAKLVRDIGSEGELPKTVYDLALSENPEQAQRTANMETAMSRIAQLQQNGKKRIVLRVYNQGPQDIDNVVLRQYLPGSLPDQPAAEKRISIDAGAQSFIDDSHFTLQGIEQNDPGQMGWVSHLIDIPDQRLQEQNRQNNWSKLFYYVLDTENPVMPDLPDEPQISDLISDYSEDLLVPDPVCVCEKPKFVVTQSVSGVSTPDEIITLYTGVNGGEVCFPVEVTLENNSTEAYENVRVISLYGNGWEEKEKIPSLPAGGVHTLSFQHCVPDGQKNEQGQVFVLYETSEGKNKEIGIGSELLNIEFVCPIALVALDPDPNPTVSEVMHGGAFARYYRAVDLSNNNQPYADADVEASFTSGDTHILLFYKTNDDGELITIKEQVDENGNVIDQDEVNGMWVPWSVWDTAQLPVDAPKSPTEGSLIVCNTCSEAVKFEVQRKKLEFEEALKAGTSSSFNASFLGFGATFRNATNMDIIYHGLKEADQMNFDKLILSRRGTGGVTQVGLSFKFDLFKAKMDKLLKKLSNEGSMWKLSFSGPSVSGEYPVISYRGGSWEFPTDGLELELIPKLRTAGLFLYSLMSGPPPDTEFVNYKALDKLVDVIIESETPNEYLKYKNSWIEGQWLSPSLDVSAFSAELSVGSQNQSGVGASINAQAAGSLGLGISYESEKMREQYSEGQLPGIDQGEEYTCVRQDVVGEINGGASLDAGLAISLQEAESEDEAANLSAQHAKLVELSGGYTNGIKIEMVLDENKAFLPKQLDVTFNGMKQFGLKAVGRTLAQTGDGSQLHRTYSVSDLKDIKRIAQRMAEYSALLDNYRKAQFGADFSPEVQISDSLILMNFMEFLALLDNNAAFWETKEIGRGINHPLGGLGGKIAGIGLEDSDSLKTDHSISFIKQRGVLKNHKSYLLEDYSNIQEPVLGNILTAIQQIKNEVVAQTADTFEKGEKTWNESTQTGEVHSPNSSHLYINNSTDFENIYGPVSFDFQGLSGPFKPYHYAPEDVIGSAEKPHYGIGGFHEYYPIQSTLSQPATLVLDYYDHELIGQEEASLAIYRWNYETNDWEYVGGELDVDNNTLTTTIDMLSTYTIAPEMPAGKIFWEDQQTTQVGENRRVSLTSEVLTLNTGEPVPDGTIYHVNSLLPFAQEDGISIPFGHILTDDADTETQGMQISVVNNRIQIDLEYPADISLMARIVIYSDQGTAFGDSIIPLVVQ